jgi:uncharacterized protein (TIGR02001 family)
MKNSIVLSAAVASIMASGSAFADVTANAAVTSNYIWRGITQTNDQAAGQGGIDWSDDSGLYAGTWVSNVAFGNSTGGGYEMDLYGGFSGEVSSIGYDVGVISYQYPIAPETNFTEVYVSGSAGPVSVGVYYTADAAAGNKDLVFDSGDLYASASVDFPVGKSDVSVYAGTYSFTNDGTTAVGDANYSHFGASISKDGFTFAMDKNTIDDTNYFYSDSSSDNVRFTASYSVDFTL